MAYEGMIAETIAINGDKGEPISAYVAKPLGPGPFPGLVVLHHAPGWDEWYRETTRKFAHHGYATISHNLYHRAAKAKPTMSPPPVSTENGMNPGPEGTVGSTSPPGPYPPSMSPMVL